MCVHSGRWYTKDLATESQLRLKVGKLQDAVIASCFLSTFNAPLQGRGVDKRAASLRSLRTMITNYLRNVRHIQPHGKCTPGEAMRKETAGRTHRQLMPTIEAVDSYISSAVQAANNWNLSGKPKIVTACFLYHFLYFNLYKLLNSRKQLVFCTHRHPPA